jgi:hypothetical protein
LDEATEARIERGHKMLGYIIPNKGELKVREFEIYNAYYCAVCRAVKERYGQLPRLMLSFDSTFLAMLLAALDREEDRVTEFRCAVHPWRKKNLIMNEAASADDHPQDATLGYRSSIDYAADMLVLLGYKKLDDDKHDEHKLRGFFGTLLYRRAYLKAAKRLPEKAAAVSERLSELASIENISSIKTVDAIDSSSETAGIGGLSSEFADAKNMSIKTVDIDSAAEPFANLMAEIMDGANETGYKSESVSRILHAMGYNLGKWIYLIDAADDYEKDMKSGSFNPLKDADIPAERIGFTLEMCLAETAKAFELLTLYKNEPILRNIIYVGLRIKTDEVMAKYDKILSSKINGS